MGEFDFHIIYKTTNLITNKFYVGRHSTNNLEDGYLGSGVYLKRSIKKHGKENFKREILEFCDNFQDLCERETFWINELNAVSKGFNFNDNSIGGVYK